MVAYYGGSMEKAFRAQYSPEFFGETLYHELRQIKTVFDPPK